MVLLSGGLDSAVALAWARRQDFDCATLTVDYGQRHRIELESARRVAASLGVAPDRQRVIRMDLRAIGGSALTDDISVPKGREESRMGDGVPITYVPARNMILLSAAIGFAETLTRAGDLHLVIGVNALDYSGYPDCREGFIRAFERAAALGTRAGVSGRAVRMHTPLVEMTKAQIVTLGASLGVDFSLTHSCYDPVIGADGEALACSGCDSCVIRRRGFEEAGVPDPTRYAPLAAEKDPPPSRAAQQRPTVTA